MKTLIIGASPNPERYSYKAAISLLHNGHDLVLAGSRQGFIGKIPIQHLEDITDTIDTITLYINPKIQHVIADKMLSLKPRRIIFNPGTENPVLMNKAAVSGIEVLEACTLVLLATKSY